MIYGQFHYGSGLGDQLFRYITVRTLAEERGWDWGMSEYWNFKGNTFLPLELGTPIKRVSTHTWVEKDVRDADGTDIRSYDPEINFIKNDTFIDGSFEDDKYWGHNLDNINKWLKVPQHSPVHNLCVIGFRGGEYADQPELFLPLDYYREAIKEIRAINKSVIFQVHTDDPALAATYFPDLDIVDNKQISHSRHTNMGLNWTTARYAKYAIIPNSAFFIIPRLLRHHEGSAVTIAPRYWARRNTKTWARPACYYKPFIYM